MQRLTRSQAVLVTVVDESQAQIRTFRQKVRLQLASLRQGRSRAKLDRYGSEVQQPPWIAEVTRLGDALCVQLWPYWPSNLFALFQYEGRFKNDRAATTIPARRQAYALPFSVDQLQPGMLGRDLAMGQHGRSSPETFQGFESLARRSRRAQVERVDRALVEIWPEVLKLFDQRVCLPGLSYVVVFLRVPWSSSWRS